MTPALRRPTVAFLICCCALLLATTEASALPGAGLGIVGDDSVFMKRWDDPTPGTKPFIGFVSGVLELQKRDCLSNGTNFCFGDNVNFCANCGTCCTSGTYCCATGGVCCGTGCCASGQTCSGGQCLSGAVTVTSITYQTVTRTATQVATVVVVVVDSSTVVSTTEVTISTADTQTNVVWVTSTAFAKRAVATLEAHPLKRAESVSPGSPSLWRRALRATWASIVSRNLPSARQPHVIHDAPALVPRQATGASLTAAAASTVTKFATQTAEVTNIVSTTITSESTSLVVTTVTRTNTIVLNAKATVDVTSVLTITSHNPVTQLTTKTENPVPTGASQTSSPTSSSSPTIVPVPASTSSPLGTSAIVGIAVGLTVLAIILVAVATFFVRQRHKKREMEEANHNNDLPPDVNALDIQPTFPVLSHFNPAAPAHHSVQFQPPGGQAAVVGAFLDPNDNSASDNPSPNRHHRSSSGFTTLVSTPGLGVNGKKADRHSAMTTASGGTAVSPATPPIPAAEMPVTEYYEVDGSSRAQNSATSPPLGQAASPPLRQQPQMPQNYRQPSYGDQTQAYGQANALGELDGAGLAEMGSDEGRQAGGFDNRYDGYGYGSPQTPYNPNGPR